MNELRIRSCPECQAPTQLADGCNHITCPICHTHWCFYCGEKSSAEEIYHHMNTKHGGYWTGVDGRVIRDDGEYPQEDEEEAGGDNYE